VDVCVGGGGGEREGGREGRGDEDLVPLMFTSPTILISIHRKVVYFGGSTP
jgi:hypothetical protein